MRSEVRAVFAVRAASQDTGKTAGTPPSAGIAMKSLGAALGTLFA